MTFQSLPGVPVKVKRIKALQFLGKRRAAVHIAATFDTHTVTWMPLEWQQFPATPAVVTLLTTDVAKLTLGKTSIHGSTDLAIQRLRRANRMYYVP
jgi:hypothetical protein